MVYKSVLGRMEIKMNRSPGHELLFFLSFPGMESWGGGGATKGHLRHRYSGEELPAVRLSTILGKREEEAGEIGKWEGILPARYLPSNPRVRCSRFCEMCLGLKVKIDKETWNTQTSAGVCGWRWRRFVVSSTDSNTQTSSIICKRVRGAVDLPPYLGC